MAPPHGQQGSRSGTLTCVTRLAARTHQPSCARAPWTEWDHLIRLQVTEALLRRAGALAWEHALRGYDAVHLAAALLWRDALGQPVSVATYDRQLWQAAAAVGLTAWPATLS